MAISEAFLSRLNNLLMLDHDAVDAYEQAIKRMKSPVVSGRLRAFQDDHRRHIADLTACITKYGGQPQNRRDVKGFFIKGMTALQSVMGDEMALKAMHTNERLTNRYYQDALDEVTYPADARAIVERNRADEARHLAWIEEALKSRVWEKEEPSSPSM
jgi:uncharacterized protein (TIGR02284 family)